jgi:hypothetical protein
MAARSTMRDLPLSKVYRFLEPGPVVPLTTACAGRGNVMTVVKAWIDPAQKNRKTIHYHGFGRFVVDGETIELKSKMR